jgi:hypothetical protein
MCNAFRSPLRDLDTFWWRRCHRVHQKARNCVSQQQTIHWCVIFRFHPSIRMCPTLRQELRHKEKKLQPKSRIIVLQPTSHWALCTQDDSCSRWVWTNTDEISLENVSDYISTLIRKFFPLLLHCSWIWIPTRRRRVCLNNMFQLFCHSRMSRNRYGQGSSTKLLVGFMDDHYIRFPRRLCLVSVLH